MFLWPFPSRHRFEQSRDHRRDIDPEPGRRREDQAGAAYPDWIGVPHANPRRKKMILPTVLRAPFCSVRMRPAPFVWLGRERIKIAASGPYPRVIKARG